MLLGAGLLLTERNWVDLVLGARVCLRWNGLAWVGGLLEAERVLGLALGMNCLLRSGSFLAGGWVGLDFSPFLLN